MGTAVFSASVHVCYMISSLMTTLEYHLHSTVHSSPGRVRRSGSETKLSPHLSGSSTSSLGALKPPFTVRGRENEKNLILLLVSSMCLLEIYVNVPFLCQTVEGVLIRGKIRDINVPGIILCKVSCA